jgi:putative SOS response-associated peptidase YedK
MCGRFSLTSGDRDIEAEFGVKVPPGYRPRYNIAPTQEVIAVAVEGGRALQTFRWGLIPSWAKDPKIGNKLINAKAETLFEKPSFRAAAKARRCLVLADGFYEWCQTEKGKIPMYIRLKQKKPFGLAGLWESWQSLEGQTVRTCTIITTEPNDLMQPIHNRMPVIVPDGLIDLWLDPRLKSINELEPILKPYAASEMEAYAVSRMVNSPANDRPECVQPHTP